ncbi:MAG: hypothetical protein ACRDYU_13560 [Actinomycetes bacterium]
MDLRDEPDLRVVLAVLEDRVATLSRQISDTARTSDVARLAHELGQVESELHALGEKLDVVQASASRQNQRTRTWVSKQFADRDATHNRRFRAVVTSVAMLLVAGTVTLATSLLVGLLQGGNPP